MHIYSFYIRYIEPIVNLNYHLRLTQPIIDGNLEKVQKALALGASVNVRNWSGTTPLQLAIIHNQMEIAFLLIKEGARLDIESSWMDTARILMATKGQVTLVKYVINKGEDFTILAPKTKRSALVQAIIDNQKQIVIEFLKHQKYRDWYEKNYDQWTKQCTSFEIHNIIKSFIEAQKSLLGQAALKIIENEIDYQHAKIPTRLKNLIESIIKGNYVKNQTEKKAMEVAEKIYNLDFLEELTHAMA